MVPAKPVLSEEEMERKSKSIIDEFLHINDYKVWPYSIELAREQGVSIHKTAAHWMFFSLLHPSE